jgi:hypothetical protein
VVRFVPKCFNRVQRKSTTKTGTSNKEVHGFRSNSGSLAIFAARLAYLLATKSNREQITAHKRLFAEGPQVAPFGICHAANNRVFSRTNQAVQRFRRALS